MVRHNIHEARTIHLRWVAELSAYEFRLMYGKTYLTPRFLLTPLDWYKLLDARGRVITFGDWVKIWRQGGLLHIAAQQPFDYGVELMGPWPRTMFEPFYQAALTERGETGNRLGEEVRSGYGERAGEVARGLDPHR